MHDDVEASSHKFGCLSETDVLARGNLISGEQVASLRKRVHAALPVLLRILLRGKVKRFRKIVRNTLLLALSYTLYVASRLRLFIRGEIRPLHLCVIAFPGNYVPDAPKAVDNIPLPSRYNMNTTPLIAWGRLPFQLVFIAIAYWHTRK